MPTKELISKLTAGLSEWLVYCAIAIVTIIGICKCIYPMLRNASLLTVSYTHLTLPTSDLV